MIKLEIRPVYNYNYYITSSVDMYQVVKVSNFCSYEQYSLAVFFKIARKYLAVLLIASVMPRFSLRSYLD